MVNSVMPKKYSDYNLQNTAVDDNPTSVEWYTPQIILEQTRKLFESDIMFDPASCAIANQLVQAKKYYSLTDDGEDGLKLPWYDGMLLNPPYGRSSQGSRFFVKAFNYHYQYNTFGNKGAIVVGRGDSQGINLLKSHFPFIMCRRISFLRWDEEAKEFRTGNNPVPGTCIFFLGAKEKETRFKELFSRFGIALRTW